VVSKPKPGPSRDARAPRAIDATSVDAVAGTGTGGSVVASSVIVGARAAAGRCGAPTAATVCMGDAAPCKADDGAASAAALAAVGMKGGASERKALSTVASGVPNGRRRDSADKAGQPGSTVDWAAGTVARKGGGFCADGETTAAADGRGAHKERSGGAGREAAALGVKEASGASSEDAVVFAAACGINITREGGAADSGVTKAGCGPTGAGAPVGPDGTVPGADGKEAAAASIACGVVDVRRGGADDCQSAAAADPTVVDAAGAARKDADVVVTICGVVDSQ